MGGTFVLAGHEFPSVTWYRDPGLRKTYALLIFVIMTSATNGYDGSMMNGLQTLHIWVNYFDQPSNATLGLLNAIMSVGGILSLPVFPYIADYFGRRWGIITGCLFTLLGVALQTAGINIHMFIAGRFFIGFGVNVAQGCSPLLLTEMCHPQHRAVFTTIYNTLWYIGAIVAAWLTFGTLQISNNWAWRIPSLVQAFPSVLQLIFVWMVDESPRYLVSKGKPEQALRVLAKAHANGNEQDEVVQLEMQEIHDTIKLEQEFASSSWLELFRTKGNRHRMIIIISAGFFSQWSGNGLVSYYLFKVLAQIGYTSSTQQDVINGVLTIYNAFCAIGACFLVDRIGRRPLFLFATAGMMTIFVGWTISAALYAQHQSPAAGKANLGMIFLFYFFYNSAWSGLLVGYSVEILPYNIRAKGMTVLFLSIDLSLFFNSYVNPIALGDIAWKYYIVYCIWLAVELTVVYFFYVETRNTPLEEMAKHFDGADAVIGGAAATEKGLQLAREAGLNDTVRTASIAGAEGVDGGKSSAYQFESVEKRT